MYALDFIYDGRLLSDYGFIVCNFDYSNGFETASIGSNITFNKVSQHSGRNFSLTSAVYGECITSTFDICKNPNFFNGNERIITNEEYRQIVQWLNRREFLKFHLIDEGNSDFVNENCYYNASFNIEKIKLNEILYGLRLTMETDKPFGYGVETKLKLIFSTANSSKVMPIISDEYGHIYPDVTILCKKDGNITLKNLTEKCSTTIKNCKFGEVIHLYGEQQIIQTSLSSHDICNDFNYDFFRIGRTFSNANNTIAASIPCDVEIKYTPIIKDIP